MHKRLMYIVLITGLLIGASAFTPVADQLGLGGWWSSWLPEGVIANEPKTAELAVTATPAPPEPTTVFAEEDKDTLASPTPVPETGTGSAQLPTPTPTAVGFKAIVAPLLAELKIAPQPDAPGVAQLKDGKVLELVGRTEPPTWVQVIYPAESDGRAWIPVTDLRVYNNVSLLPVVAAAEPMATTAPAGMALAPTATPEIAAMGVSTDVAPNAMSLAVGELTVRIAVETLNVRTGPGTSYAVLDKLHLDERVQVVGRNEQGDWLQVVFDADRGLSGWVSAPYVEASGDIHAAPSVRLPAVRPQPAPAPDDPLAGQLAILTKSGGDLYVVDADGSNLRYITGGVLDPALSPDGAQLAYTRWSGGALPEGVYVLDLMNGVEESQASAHLPRTPVWSPDGQSLVFAFQQGGQEDYVDIELRSGLVELPPDPDWHLGYVDTQTGAYQDVPALLQSQNPSWSPDGVRIVYDGDQGLELTSLSGSTQPLSQDWRQGNPVWSPTGEWIVFEVRAQDHIDLYIMREDGSDVRALTQPDPLLDRAVNNVSPTWSPDGQWLAFLTDRGGEWAVYVMRPDGSEQHPLFPEGLPEISLHYQSAGERLLSWSSR